MDFQEKGYKFVSASAAAVENVARPANEHHHRMMYEGSTQIHNGVDEFFNILDSETKGKVSWFFRGLKKINRGIEKVVKSTIGSSYQDSESTLKVIQEGFNQKQEEFEEYFNKNNKTVHHNWAFSKENRELIREISDFVKDNTQELRDVEYGRLIQCFIAFARVQKAARFKHWVLEKHEMSDFFKQGLVSLNKFCKFSVGIYGKFLVNFLIEKKWAKLFQSETDLEILLNYCEMPQEFVLFSHIESRKYFPGYAVIAHHELEAVILSIRGTMSVFDCITDVKGEYSEYTYIDLNTQSSVTGLVHTGIFLCAQNLSAEVKPLVLETLARYPSYQLIICGHSLGAGTTALLSLLWMSDEQIMTKPFLGLAYAPPPVVSNSLNVVLKRVLFSCVYGHDVVSRLSFGALRDLCEMVKFWEAYDKVGTTTAGRLATSTLYGGELNDNMLVDIYKDLKSRFFNMKLEAPGNVVQVYLKEVHKDYQLIGEGEKYVWSFVESSFYQEVIFSSSCFEDHFPDLYEDGLKWIVENS